LCFNVLRPALWPKLHAIPAIVLNNAVAGKPGAKLTDYYLLSKKQLILCCNNGLHAQPFWQTAGCAAY
jgi:hypothetical protein